MIELIFCKGEEIYIFCCQHGYEEDLLDVIIRLSQDPCLTLDKNDAMGLQCDLFLRLVSRFI